MNIGNLLRAAVSCEQDDDDESYADAMMWTQVNPQR
jgi:hypothetical protein